MDQFRIVPNSVILDKTPQKAKTPSAQSFRSFRMARPAEIESTTF
jgi:hypothetical protein